MTERTGAGDPTRRLALLWRHRADPHPRPGPPRSRSVDTVVAAAVGIADAEGLGAVTMRRLGRELRTAPMSLYTYVHGRPELVDLMVDHVVGAMTVTTTGERDWRARVRAVADDNRRLLHEHPWLTQVSMVRPPLGPGVLGRYERELQAFDGLGLTDVEMDAALTLVVGIVRSVAVGEVEVSAGRHSSGLDDAQWWAINASLLAEHVEEDRYPLASRVGTAAGSAHGATYGADHAYQFGLEIILDGLAARIASSPEL
jgi:AcrR family transcriptional regulator